MRRHVHCQDLNRVIGYYPQICQHMNNDSLVIIFWASKNLPTKEESQWQGRTIGLNSLFAISDSSGMVSNLMESSHLFNLDNVIKEHDTRTLNSSQVFTINTDSTSSST